MVSVQSQAKFMQFMRFMQSRVLSKYPGSGSLSSVTRFQVVLKDLLEFVQLAVVVVEPWLDTKVQHKLRIHP